MEFVKDNILVNRTDNILLEKWLYEDVTGDKYTDKPGFCIFDNTVKALCMLQKHIINKSTVALHIDVDMDGIGSAFILTKFLNCQGVSNLIHVINKDKVHGIQEKHPIYFNGQCNIDLIIISDSSSNELDNIKKFNCDVLVIDHHEILHNETSGKCNDGVHDFVIVNNTIDNSDFEMNISWLKSRNINAFNNVDKYIGDNRMSCGLVIYELLRIYCECFSNPQLLENLMLYQWVGVTLFTDAIQLITPRNQWYIDKTVHNNYVEPSLKRIMNVTNRWKVTLDKTYIGYTLAPLVNKAIRAGDSLRAMRSVIFEPEKIVELDVYKKNQADAVNKVLYKNYEQLTKLIESYTKDGTSEEDAKNKLKYLGYVVDFMPRTFNEDEIMVDISSYNIHHNYAGVIAGRICGETNKNTACYTVLDDGRVGGSFRGRNIDTDYRKYFEQYSDDIYAQGHPTAFGFKCKLEQLQDIMHNLNSIESSNEIKEFFSVGNIPVEERGIYHINSFDEFKKNGYLLRIGIGNSKVSTKDEVNIKIPANALVLKEIKGKLYTYEAFGLECKAFERLEGKYFKLYLEFTNELVAYIKKF